MTEKEEKLCSIYWFEEGATTSNAKKRVIEIKGKTLEECYKYIKIMKNEFEQ